MNYLESLNEPQRQAVTSTDGPVMVIAGPGSGKTRVLTFRIAYLIQSGVLPWNILALTFTNKAAREMKSRIQKVVGDDAYKVWAGTFHSIFARILRVEASKIGYPGDFTIYDTDDTKSVVKEIIKELGLDTKTYNPGAVRNRISSAKSNIITYKMYGDNVELMEQDRFNRRPMTYKIYERYVKRLEKNGAMDFDDLLLNMFKLLYQNPENVVEKYRRQFQFVLVDEFQDTNFLQYEIVKKLAKYEDSRENICIVGDDAQSIYSFRGATIENILQFERDFPATQVFKLEQNYRSTDHIVNAANDVITYNKRQLKKEIWTDKKDGQRIRIIRALSDTEEGRKVTSSIIELKNRNHLANKEIAVLYRTNAQSRIFEEYLRRQNINYRIFGGLSFYQRKEIKDLLAFMRVTVNPKDDEAVKRALVNPRRGIGKTTIEKLMNFAQNTEQSGLAAIDQAPIKGRGIKLLVEFRNLILSFRKYSETHNAYDTALYIYKHSGLQNAYTADNSLEGVTRLENLAALLDGVQEFAEADEVIGTANEDRSLAAYLQNIALLTDFDTDDSDDDFVTLMSVHAAKGLEYRAVFVVGMEENLFPSFMSMDTQDGIDEERRLFYVAITRAEEYLTLSYANSRYQYGQIRTNDVSRFIEEIDEKRIDDSSANITRQSGPTAASIRGGVVKKMARSLPKVDLANFVVAHPSKIAPGQRVRHMKFGDGTVKDVEGANQSKVASIEFDAIEEPQKRIMLKFAKLMILDE